MAKRKEKIRDPFLVWVSTFTENSEKFTDADVDALKQAVAKGRDGVADILRFMDHVADVIRLTAVHKLVPLSPLSEKHFNAFYDWYWKEWHPNIKWDMKEVFRVNEANAFPKLMAIVENDPRANASELYPTLGVFTEKSMAAMLPLIEKGRPNQRAIAYDVIGEIVKYHPETTTPELINLLIGRLTIEKGSEARALLLLLSCSPIMIPEIFTAIKNSKLEEDDRAEDMVDLALRRLARAYKTGVSAKDYSAQIMALFEGGSETGVAPKKPPKPKKK